MKPSRCALIVGLALTAANLALPAAAQASGDSCILAGRLSDDGRWAPRMAGVQLLGPNGKVIAGAGKAGLSSVKQVRLTAPALLSQCDGDRQLGLGPESPGRKTAVPAIGPGIVAVESVQYPKLRRGGEMVELQIAVPADRVTMITR